MESTGHVRNVVVVRRNGEDVNWVEGRDLWWDDTVERRPANTPPSGMMPSTRSSSCTPPAPPASPRASCTPPAATSPQAAFTHKAVFDLHPETDVFWCTADVGWVTGHSYIIYAPLVNGATQVCTKAPRTTPHQGRWWEIVEKYKVSILYTRPHRDPDVHEVGPGDPRQVRSLFHPRSAAPWANRSTPRRGSGTGRSSANAGKRRTQGNPAPIVDTWWQTETGAHMIARCPAVTATQARLRAGAAARNRRWTSWTKPASRWPTVKAATWWSANRGPPCSAVFGATPSASRTPTGRGSGHLLRRRRGQEGRRRRHLAAGPGG